MSLSIRSPCCFSSRKLTPGPDQRVVVLRDEPLLEGDDRVVGDLDLLGTHLGTALGDVAEAQAGACLDQLEPIVTVEWVHFQRRQADEEARTGKERLVRLVIADHVADVLAKDALDALVELLAAIDVFLEHAPRTVGFARSRPERGDGLRLLVVERDVRDQVLDRWERPHRRDRDRLAFRESIHPRHTHQPRTAVHFGAARATAARLTIPADRQVRRLRFLDAVDHVEHHHALFGRDVIVAERTPAGVAAPHTHRHLRPCHTLALTSSFSSSGIAGSGSSLSVIAPSDMRVTRLIWAKRGSASGKSERVWPPRLSLRASADRVMASETVSIVSMSNAMCQPGLK